MPTPTTPSRRPLAGLLVSQFFGAFNDNAWKYVLILLMTRPALSRGVTGEDFERAQQMQTTLAMLVFTLPMILFSLPAGALADRVSKRSVILAAKVLEVVLMTLAAASLWHRPDEVMVPLAVLGLMGAQSALFSPAKYGILPEILPHSKLSMGNGLLEMWTMLAIIAGSALGPVMLGVDDGGARPQYTWLAAGMLSALSLVGLVAAWFVPHVPSASATHADTSAAPRASALMAGWRAILDDRVLKLAVLGSVFYWTIISLLGQNVYVYSRAISAGLEWQEAISGLPVAAFGVGIAIGAVIAGKLSGAKVEYGLIPLGALSFAVVSVLFGVMLPGIKTTIAFMVLLGIGGGLLVVPINAVIQWRSPADRRGAVIALSNIITMAGILAGSLTAGTLGGAGLSTGTLLLVSAGLVIIGTVWALWLLPDALLRLVLVLLTHTFYRLKVAGRTNIPETGGALIVPNHMSFVDGLFILASTDRPVRFIVYAGYYNKWWAKPFMRCMKAIQIDDSGGPRVILKALRDAGKCLDEGDLVCIFAEGQISRTGSLLPFRRGMERIVKGRDVPIIPAHLDRVWGSIFSFDQRHFVFKLPRQLPYPVTVSYSAPMPATSPFWRVRQRVQELAAEAWLLRAGDRRPLHRSFIRRARRSPLRTAFFDPMRGRVSAIKALAGGITLARLLRDDWRDQRRVGVMLPPSAAGAMVNLAAAMTGRTSVNLNYTTGPGALESAATQAELKTVVTSRLFLEKAKVTLPGNVTPVYLDDVAPRASRLGKLAALFVALFAPARLVERFAGATRRITVDDEVTIIFSSGSTGEPKGVVLTHANIDANAEGVSQLFHLTKRDRMLGILPLFHSFGYMTLWFAANEGMPIAFHPNPLDAEAVGGIIERHRVTIMIATPTFLQFYLRRCSPGSLGSLRMVLTGAEKLPDRLCDAFELRFGIRPMEGYGSTECSPVVAACSPDVRYPGVYQAGSRRGSVGQPLPGVAVRVVDPEATDSPEQCDPLPPNETGMLLVKGPNVMSGYLNKPELTAKVVRDGWYVTGDIARVDDDGFIFITDRLSRFSKIAGEMVPHGKVEDALHQAAAVSTQTFAVTAVPDEKKGEKLAVLHTFSESRIGDLVAKLTDMGLPNLFVPRPDQFVKVDALPILGTGKLDLRAMKQIAKDRLQ